MSRRRNNKGEDTNPDYALAGVGNYIFQKTLGEGNFAKVKLAKHKLTSLEVAIKMIDKTQLDEKKLGKLYREVRIMKMLHHPNIVKLYEVIETKSSVFLVMEYASGGELYDYLVVHGRLKEKEARVKFNQILGAVNYCHKKRVIHRDLKAENLLLDANFNIKIADFGFSNLYDPESQLETFCGSPPYAAPELFQGKAYTGPEVDVWSLGVILYVLTTGYLPFDGKTLAEMRESVCKAKFRIPFYLSENTEKLLRKMLVKDPSKRATLDLLLDDPWLNTEGVNPLTEDLSLKVEEDERIFKIMQSKYNFSKDQVQHSLKENLYDDISAIYYLLYCEKDKIAENDEEIEDGLSQSYPVRSTLVEKVASNVLNVPNQMKSISEDEEATTDSDSSQLKVSLPGSPGSQQDVKKGSAKAKKEALVTTSTIEAPAKEIRKLAVGSGHRRRFTVGSDQKQKVSSSPTSPLRKQLAENSKEKDAEPKSARPRRSTLSNMFKRKSTEPNDESKPRVLRFTFNSRTTSTASPEDIITNVVRHCVKLNLKFKPVSKYLLECQVTEHTKFEIEVCKLPRLNNVHGLRFKRLCGSSSEYKATCEKFLETCRI